MARITTSAILAPVSAHPFPVWARPAVLPEQDLDAAFLAGAGLATLDALVRKDQPWGGVWRQRLALTAAAASVRAAGRAENEAGLRDAYYLRNFGDDPGPAGRILVFWRQLAGNPKNLDEDSVFRAVQTLGLKPEEALGEIIRAARRQARKERPAVFAAAEIVAFTVAQRPDAELLGLWLADSVLAQRLNWKNPLPLLAAQIFDPLLRSGAHQRRPRPEAADWIRLCCFAYARAAAYAVDSSAELGRRVQNLHAVAPKLRAKGAGVVTKALLNEDALTSSSRLGNMSDRGLRRLFGRLENFGAVRELSGRASFRLYGL